MDNATWRDLAVGRLVLCEDADVERAEAAVSEAESLAVAEGQSLWSLFGDPRQWAKDHVTTWRAESYWYLSDDVGVPWQLGLLMWPLFSLGLAVLAGCIELIEGALPEQVPLHVVLFGQLLGLGVSVTGWVYAHYSPRYSLVQTLLRVGPTLLGFSVVGALVATTSWPPLITPVNVWFASAGYVFLAVVGGVLAWRYGLAPTATQKRYTRDEDWLSQTRQLLHSHSNLSHSEITDLLDEAQDHTQQSGQSLVAEFGAPARYAAQYKTRSTLSYRRDENYIQGCLMLVLAVIGGTSGGGTWWSLLAAVFLVGCGCHTIFRQWRVPTNR